VVYVAGFEGDTFKTYHKVSIPVKARKRPGDYTLSLSDNEVYSFKSMSDRITNIEDEIKSEGSILYNYTLDADGVKLVEASGKKSIGEYIPLVSSSLKAVKGLSDKFKTMIDANTKLGETALSIAKGINSAKVFDTTADMEAWLSDENNKGKCQVGNNLYIIDVDVPDWWIAEVLDTPDSETGYYYKIAQLEVQKVDLTDINEDIDALENRIEFLENRESGLAPQPITNVSATGLGYVDGTSELNITWDEPTIYDVRIGGLRLYGYIGDNEPTLFSQFTELKRFDKNSTAETVVLDNTYDYILVASVSTDNVIQEDLSQMCKPDILENYPTKDTPLDDVSWEYIAKISEGGLAQEYFSIGDTKSIEIDGENYEVAIYDFNHDKLINGSSEYVRGITFGLVNCLTTKYTMRDNASNSGGYSSSALSATVNSTIYNMLPEDLKNKIKSVTKYYQTSTSSTTLQGNSYKLFLFSQFEISGSTDNSVKDGDKYPIFTEINTRIKKLGDNGDPTPYWTRSIYTAHSACYSIIKADGTLAGGYANSESGVSFGFCI
jgi:hypothetical protein